MEWIDIFAIESTTENYTATIVNEIQPDIFQIGNEINNGFIFSQRPLQLADIIKRK